MLENNVERHIRTKYELLQHDLDERMRRLWAASEAIALGHGGVATVSRATGLAESTIRIGCKQLREPEEHKRETFVQSKRARKPGAGRKRLTEEDSTLVSALEILMEPCEGPAACLRWTTKGTRKLAAEMTEEGYIISHMKVAQLLEELSYSLKTAARKPGFTCHPDSDAQFKFINDQIEIFHKNGQLVISLEAITRILQKCFTDAHRNEVQSSDMDCVSTVQTSEDFTAWCQKQAYMPPSEWAERPVTDETILFAGKMLRRWWLNTGSKIKPTTHHLFVVADVGDVNGETCKLWTTLLQNLADNWDVRISVCHIPNGTKKWSKILQCTTSHIVEILPDKSCVRHEVTINRLACPSSPLNRKAIAEFSPASSAKTAAADARNLGIEEYNGDGAECNPGEPELEERADSQGSEHPKRQCLDMKAYRLPGDAWNYTVMPTKSKKVVI